MPASSAAPRLHQLEGISNSQVITNRRQRRNSAIGDVVRHHHTPPSVEVAPRRRRAPGAREPGSADRLDPNRWCRCRACPSSTAHRRPSARLPTVAGGLSTAADRLLFIHTASPGNRVGVRSIRRRRPPPAATQFYPTAVSAAAQRGYARDDSRRHMHPQHPVGPRHPAPMLILPVIETVVRLRRRRCRHPACCWGLVT